MKNFRSILILFSLAIVPLFSLSQGELIGASLAYGPVTNVTVSNVSATNSVTNTALLTNATSVGVVGVTSMLRDAQNTYDILFPNLLVLKLTGTGPGALDQGTISTNALYAVYVIADSHRRNKSNTMVIISTNFTRPYLPTNSQGVNYAWNVWRRVGAVRTFCTNSITNVVPFVQVGSGRVRSMQYLVDSAYTALATSGTNLTYTSVDASVLVPTDCDVYLNVQYIQGGTNGAGGVHLMTGSSASISDNGSFEIGHGIGTTSANAQRSCVIIPCLNRAFNYRVLFSGNIAAFYVAGYRDEL